jgi:hypothetical protein
MTKAKRTVEVLLSRVATPCVVVFAFAAQVRGALQTQTAEIIDRILRTGTVFHVVPTIA